ncbi:hypothetical protein [Nonomuraea sp. NPDC005650]|uniref:hypothetical protein n=1 Tax=Nonomuraea sp. NPDC005650 TaxID=3157045 RepID=UPI0033B8F056
MATTTAAVVESGAAPFTLTDVELDEPRRDEAVVRTVAADLTVASGGLPFPLPGVLGHEGAGVVEAGAPIGGHFFGQSSFARRALVDERSLVKVDPEVPPATIAPLDCGVQTGAGAVWNVLRPGDTVAVLGAGSVGLSAVMAVMAVALTPAARWSWSARRRSAPSRPWTSTPCCRASA